MIKHLVLRLLYFVLKSFGYLFFILFFGLFSFSYADEFEVSYVDSGINQTYSFYPGIFSVNWYNNILDVLPIGNVFGSGGDVQVVSTADLMSFSSSCSSSVGSTLGFHVVPDGNWFVGRQICGDWSPGQFQYQEVLGSVFDIPPYDDHFSSFYGQNIDDQYNSLRVFVSSTFSPGTNSPFPKVDGLGVIHYPLSSGNHGMSEFTDYGMALTGSIDLYNYLNYFEGSPSNSIPLSPYDVPFSAPGYSYSVLKDGNIPLYYEVYYNNFYTDHTIFYDNYFVTYIGNVPNPVTKIDPSYNQFSTIGFDSSATSFSTFVGQVLTGFDNSRQMVFTVYDCYIPGLANIKNCPVLFEGRIPITEGTQIFLRRYGSQFSSFSTGGGYFVMGDFLGQQVGQYNYSDVVYFSSRDGYFTGDVLSTFSGVSPDYSYTPPDFPVDPGLPISGGNNNGTNNSGNFNFTGFQSSVSSGFSLSGNLIDNIFYCPLEFNASSPFVVSLRSVSNTLFGTSSFFGDIIDGVVPDSLENFNYLGFVSCPVGALMYGLDNSPPIFRSTTGTSYWLSRTTNNSNYFEVFFSVLLAVPGVWIFYKLLFK